MDKANLERLRILLQGHEDLLEEKRARPEGVLRQNDLFREQFNRVARSVIVPLLEEIKDVMVGKVESASIFHRSTAAGLTVKLDRWEDYDRSLLFFGDDSTQMVKVTHEGIGFGLLSDKLPVAQLTKERVEEEAMKFLKRLFGQEQLRRPTGNLNPAGNGAANGSALRRPPVSVSEFVRV
ncbi:MAG TPA: hypothetical protein VIA62_25305 [Thermoanaerobaculia bacterium]|jgi:hypothetical protein|nr:hypothetical protein [Thermoanaerobaculia bacterium]